MSRFYGGLQGDRGGVTREGHRGIHSHVRGWDIGVKVDGRVNTTGEDVFHVVVTGGSNNPDAVLEDAGMFRRGANGKIERLQ